jgi:hypothetical protein
MKYAKRVGDTGLVRTVAAEPFVPASVDQKSWCRLGLEDPHMHGCVPATPFITSIQDPRGLKASNAEHLSPIGLRSDSSMESQWYQQNITVKCT